MATLTIATDTNWSSLEDTSTSAISVSLAIKSITVSAGKSWTAGMPLAMTAVGTKLHTCMFSTAITSYSGTTLTMTTNGFTSAATDAAMLPSMWGNFANQAFSQSSVVIGASGTKVFWTRPNLTLVPGDAIRAVNRGSNATYIEGTVASYHAATGNLVMTATSSNGSGTVSDWVFVSVGTISNWIIHTIHNDTVSVNNGVKLTIDHTNYGLPTNVVANGTGDIYIPNTSTTDPIIFRLSSRPHNTNYGRITVQQNATFKTRGNWIEVATGTGAALNYTFPSKWDAMSAPTYTEVETYAGSGVYERWPVMGSMFYSMGRYGHIYGGDTGKTPTNLLISKTGGGTGIGTLGAITPGSGYGGVLSTLGTITGGTGGTTGTYTNVALTVSSGTVGNGATANITVYGGAVVAVQFVNPGSGYTTTSVLSALSASIGNVTGFSVPVTAILTSWIFSNVPLTGGTGTGALAHITVTLGAVSAVEIVDAGIGYTAANSLSASATYIGAGTGFAIPITLIGVPLGTFKCSGGSGANGIVTITAINSGGIGRLGAITGGSGYTNGTYTDVPLTAVSTSAGAGARATIVVAGGTVTSVTLTTSGYGYAASLTITALNTFLGGTGANFQVLVSTVANSLQGAYFSGYDGAPSAYAVGDLLTVECGGSLKPVLYVAEVGDFASTTPATNIINSICETVPTQLTGYHQYIVYDCTGGSGTGAKYVTINGGSGNTRAVGSQYGYFVAGTGYAVNDVITVGDYGFQVRVTEIQNTLPINFTNKVCTWDAAGRTLRFGADPDSAAVPNGAKVRVPNIVIDGLPVEMPLLQSVTETNPTWYFESGPAIGSTATAASAHCEYENLSWAAKVNNTVPTTRGFRGTRKSTHPAGAIVTQIPSGRAAGAQRAQFNTSTGGELDLSITMFGYWFMFSSSATRNISAVNVGWSGALIAGNTTGPVLVDKFCNSCHPFQQNEHQWSVSGIQNTFALSNGVCAQIKAADATTSEPFISVSSCPTITKFSNLDVFTAREWQGANRSIQLINSFFTNDTTAIPQYIRLVGGMLYISSMANFRLHHLSFGANCCRTLTAITPAGSFSYTNTSYSNGAFLFTNSSNIICHNVDSVAQPIKGSLISSDAGCANIVVHTGNGTLSGVSGYYGNGAFGGINLIAYLLNNTGLNIKIANLHVSNLRVPFTCVANNTQTQNIVQNIRTPIALTNQGGTQTDFVSTALSFRSSSGLGIGHGSLDSCDYVTGYTPYWSTGGSMTPNLPDATWFQNLVDAGISPTTGRIAIGCGGPNSSKTQYVVTGSNNSYPDNGGRFYLGGSADIVEFTNWFPMRGITGFQSVNPASNFGAATQNTTDGWLRYTLTSGGTGYGASGTLYSVSGGSGYGGSFLATIVAGVVTLGCMQTGIGYQVGDVLTLIGGGNNCVITLMAVVNVQVRMVPWGQDIATATYADLTYANLQSSFAAMTGYDSNVGLQVQMRVTNDSNTHDLQGYMNWYELFTTVDSSFNPPIGYTDIELSNLQSGSRIAAYSGSTILDSDTSTTTGVLTVPYTFDGAIPTTDIKIKKYGYLNANYTQGYGKDTVVKAVIQTADSSVVEATVATVAAYTDLSDTVKQYDYCQYYFTTTAADLLAPICTKNGTQVNYGSYNLVYNSSAASVFSLVGSTITMRVTNIVNGSVITTGTVTYLGSAVAQIPITSSAGTTGVLTINGLSGHNVYLQNGAGVQQDYQVGVSSYSFYIPAGATGTWRWRAVKYGKIPETGTFIATGGGLFSVTIDNVTDASIVQPTLATVLAYTTLETIDKQYDYCRAFLTTSAGKALGSIASKSGANIDYGAYGVTYNATAGSVFTQVGSLLTIKASTVSGSGTVTTTGTILSINGCVILLTYYDASGPHLIGIGSVSGFLPNSRIIVHNATKGTTPYDALTTGDLTFVYAEGTDYSIGDTVNVYHAYYGGAAAKKKGVISATVSASGWSVSVSQATCDVYAAYYSTYGVDGATVYASGDFVKDGPHLQIDLNDGDNLWYGHRLFMWDKYQIWYNAGNRSFFMEVSAPDAGNITIGSLYLDNLMATTAYQGDTISITNNTSTLPVINPTTGGGGITMYSGGKVLTTSSGGLAPSEAQIKSWVRAELATEMARIDAAVSSRNAIAPDNTNIAAIKAKTDTLVNGPTLANIEASAVLAKQDSLVIINDGVQKASLFIPHNQSL